MQFSKFIERYKAKLSVLFTEQSDINQISLERGLPQETLSEILDCKPLSAFIPSEYGGRGVKTHEALSMLEISSYHSLPLSLMMGINGALFLQPVANYANNSVKKSIFDRFLNQNNMGGLMITEPDYGSDALRMKTSFHKSEDGKEFNISGTKHWAGLTGQADFWLITARKKDSSGNLGRDISFFIHDTNRGGIEVEEYYKNLGLYMLPYGRNKIDITVPQEYKLKPKSIGIKMMLDILHRSRLQFPGMGMGFLKRLLDEAHRHCKERFVGGQSLFNYDQVKKRISRMQSAFTVCSAMCAYTSEHVTMDRDVSSESVAANTIKTVTTDMMHNASQSLQQLMGAKGYCMDHIAGRAMIDSRPFQIFEGSNDILYQQISEAVIKSMRGMKLNNLYDYLSDFKLTEHAADYLEEVLNFEVDSKMAQDKLVELGQALSRVISLQMTLKLGEKGFNPNLISSTIETLRSDAKSMLGTFRDENNAEVIEDYEELSSWLNIFPPVPA
jgi:alkylation response protein AidB-like acyl-CoA dehydrogenase